MQSYGACVDHLVAYYKDDCGISEIRMDKNRSNIRKSGEVLPVSEDSH